MFTTPVFADTPFNNPSQLASIMPQALLIIGLVFFYFVILRPQAQRQKDKQNLLSALQKGDVVYTSGGIVGKVIQIQQNFCQIEVSTNIRIYIQKEAIIDLVPKGSLKSLGFE